MTNLGSFYYYLLLFVCYVLLVSIWFNGVLAMLRRSHSSAGGPCIVALAVLAEALKREALQAARILA